MLHLWAPAGDEGPSLTYIWADELMEVLNNYQHI